MANSLTTLLALAKDDPEQCTAFYQALLTSEVYTLLPAVGNGLEEGKARFVMWMLAEGGEIIPCFTSRAAVRRVLTSDLITLRMTGLHFLRLARGASVMVDPNEAASCHLTADDVKGLLAASETADSPFSMAKTDTAAQLHAVATPPLATLQALTVTLSREPTVRRAYLVGIQYPNKTEQPGYIVMLLAAGADEPQLMAAVASAISAAPADRVVECSTMVDSNDPLLLAAARLTAPFYEAAPGESGHRVH